MNDKVREIIHKVSPFKDWVDEIFLQNTEKYMTHFDLISFRTSYPSLYATIRESIKQASQVNIPNN